MAAQLSVRPATIAESDHERLIDFRDSQAQWLASVGSGDQWGSKSYRELHPDASEKTRAWVERSEKTQAHQAEFNIDWCRAFIAEASTSAQSTDPANGPVPVAGLVLDAVAPSYASDVLPEQDANDPFVYLAYLISNRHAQEQGKGAGSVLIAHAKEQTRSVGLQRICLDCFSGNDRKLVKYYESQGFKPIGDFVADPKGRNWHGCVLEMRLE